MSTITSRSARRWVAGVACLVLPLASLTGVASADTTPQLSIGSVTATEGDAGSTPLALPVTLSAPSRNTVTVFYATSDNSAQSPADFEAQSGSLTFAPGETTKTISVAIAGDTLDEALEERFTVTLSSPVNAVFGPDSANGSAVIADDDGDPTASVSNPSVVEGTGSTVNAAFQVTLGAASARSVSVRYETRDSSAVAARDYSYRSGTLTFNPGQRSKTVNVPVVGDRLTEAHDELFLLELSSCSGCSLQRSYGYATVVDDDLTPYLSIDDRAVVEGANGATTNALFTVSLSKPAVLPVTVRYGTSNNTAITPSDYTATRGTLKFAVGESTKQVTVPVRGDGTPEPDESFFVSLSEPVNAGLARSNGFGIIRNDEGSPSTVSQVSVLDAVVTEGAASIGFPVQLSHASSAPITVTYSTASSSATEGEDFTATPSGEVVIPAGATTGSLPVSLLSDAQDEDDEQFFLSIGATGGALVDSWVMGVVQDDDHDPAVTVSDGFVRESAGTVSLTVGLTAPSTNEVSLAWQTQDGTASSDAGDYTASSGVVAFAPGETSKTVQVPVVDDQLDEGDGEYFRVLVTSTSGARRDSTPDPALVHIADDDVNPYLAVDAPVVREGDTGAGAARFTVTLSSPPPTAVTVGYSTFSYYWQTTEGVDFTPVAGDLVFAAGETVLTVDVPVLGDRVHEPMDVFGLQLGAGAGVTANKTTSYATILDDDVAPTLSVSSPTVTESAGSAAFVLTLSSASANPVTVDVASIANEAEAGVDFGAASASSVSFPAGTLQRTVTVPVLQDTLDESDEGFWLQLSNLQNAVEAPSHAHACNGCGWAFNGYHRAVIQDDDTDPVLVVSNPVVVEGNTGSKNMVFTVSLSSAKTTKVGFELVVGGGSATEGEDFLQPTVPAAGWSISANSPSRTVVVPIVGDTFPESDESLYLQVYNAVGAQLSGSYGLGLVLDNDPLVAPAPQYVSITDASVVEGDTGTTDAVFTATLNSTGPTKAASVQWRVFPSSADDTDVETTYDTLEFAAGEASKTFSVPVSGDRRTEGAERFVVQLSDPAGATLNQSQAYGTILDDDRSPSLVVSDATVEETDAGSVAASVNVSLSSPAAEDVVVDVITSAMEAQPDEDYAHRSERLTFAPGETSKTFTTDVLADTRDENDEWFTISLVSPVGATPADGGAVRILDADLARLTVQRSGNGAAGGQVTAAPAGISCGGDCTEDYALGTSVVLTAAPEAGRRFVGWTGSCTGTGACAVDMTQDRLVTAEFAIITYPLTVSKSGGGSGTVSGPAAGLSCGTTCAPQVDHGTVVDLTAAAASGSTFAGWGGACTGTGACSVTMTEARTVTASFTLDDQTLSVSRVGTGAGTVTSNPAGIACGTTCSRSFLGATSVTLSAAPSAGSRFVGWSGDCAGSGACTVTLTQARAVTAEFALLTYEAAVTKAGTGSGFVTSNLPGIDCGAACSASYNHGSTVVLTATAATGSTFVAWSGACSGKTTCSLPMTEARLVTATFQPDRRLTLTKSGAGSGTITSSPLGISCGSTCTALYKHGTSVSLTQTPAAGSTFVGWSGFCSGTGACTVPMSANRTVIATYALNDQTLTVSRTGTGTGTVSSSPAGIACGTTCSKTYTAGTAVTLSAVPAAGSTFVGWSGACSGTGACSVTLTDSRAVGAEFALITRSLTVTREGTGLGFVTSSPSGIDCGGDCSESYPQGTSVSLTAIAAKGSTFAGWGGACSGTGACVVAMSAARAVTALFTLDLQQVTVSRAGTGSGTVTSDPGGISCGTTCAAAFPGGSAVTLTAAPEAGSTFLGWTGACSGTSTCSLTMTEARSVTASFRLDDQTLTVEQAGAGTGTVSSSPAGISCGADCSEAFPGGTTVVLSAAPDALSVFTGWSGACTGSGGCTVTMTQARSVTANFALADQTLTVSRTGTGSGTVSSSPAGINCGADCDEVYSAGTAVTLTASPAAGSAFAGWSGDCTGTGSCVTTLDGPRAVVATFNLASPGAGTYEESDPAIVYAGTWSTGSNSNDSGGAVRHATNGPATASLTFSGTSITWIARKQANAGFNKVFVDGVLVATVDRYNATTRFKQVLYTLTGMPDTTHTIRIEHTGTRNGSATDDNVMLDAFIVG